MSTQVKKLAVFAFVERVILRLVAMTAGLILVTDTLAWHPLTSSLKDMLSRISGSIATEDSLKNCMSELVAQIPRILFQTVPLIEILCFMCLCSLGGYEKPVSASRFAGNVKPLVD